MITCGLFESDCRAARVGLDAESIAELPGKLGRICGFDGHHFPSDFGSKLLGGTDGHELSLVQDRNSLALFGFFHQMRRCENGDSLIRECFEILPEIVASGWVQSGTGLVQDQEFRTVKQPLGQLCRRARPPDNFSTRSVVRSVRPTMASDSAMRRR